MRKSIFEQLTLRHSGCSWHQPKKVRVTRMRIPAQGYKAGVDVPALMLQGMWLYGWEFESGGWVKISASRGETRAGGGSRGAAEGSVVPQAWVDERVEASATGDSGFDLSCRTLVAQVVG